MGSSHVTIRMPTQTLDSMFSALAANNATMPTDRKADYEGSDGDGDGE